MCAPVVVNGKGNPVRGGSGGSGAAAAAAAASKAVLSENDLDLLAVFFTVTKVLYVTGKKFEDSIFVFNQKFPLSSKHQTAAELIHQTPPS